MEINEAKNQALIRDGSHSNSRKDCWRKGVSNDNQPWENKQTSKKK
jgi:hypothetical protein